MELKKQDILKFIEVGAHRVYKTCRFCFSENVVPVIDLGDMPLAGGFIKKGTKKSEFHKEKFYPLVINFCKDCYLLQVNSAVDADILFKNYFYFSSSISTLIEHFEKTVKDMKPLLSQKKKPFVAEIGCNDGGFINALQNNGYKAIGIDPATNVVKPLIKKGLPIVNDYFTNKVATKIVKSHGNADAIYSFHSMAHIEDMHDVIAGVKTLLKKDGYLAFEVHYLGNLIHEKQYDMIYHEHQYYYSLLAMQNFFAQYDMEVFDVKQIPIRGGSIMYFVQNKDGGTRDITQRLKDLAKLEKKQGLDNIKTYESYAKEIKKTKTDLLKLLNKLKSQNKKIAGYGASGRGTIIMNYCGLDEKYLDYVIDDAPAKHGAFTPGTRLEIVLSNILATKKRPDYVVLFAWPFIEEVKKRNVNYLQSGGKIIVPLPDVKVVS